MKNVEDLFPLSPMQKMMLLHTVTAPDSDVLFNQFCYEIKGDLDIPAFRRAWQWLVDAHPALRAVFLWENLKEPLQAIRKSVEIPFESDNLDNLPDAERKAHLDALIARDRHQPFDPARAPLMRVRLIRLAEDSHFLIWSSHHLLLDRFCLPTVFDDLGRAYEGIQDRGSPSVQPRRSFRHYIGWLQEQDHDAARAYWRRTLTGFRAPTAFESQTAEGATHDSEHKLASVQLDESVSARARDLAKRHRVTLSCVFQGAIAVALAKHCQTRDVVFGATVSGRPPELDGVESIIGSFVNNVPIRIRLASEDPIAEWLRAIQQQLQERQAYDYVARSDIEGASDLVGGASMFDTLFVWLASVPPATVNGFQLYGVEGHVRTGYPVTISVSDETPRLRIEVNAAEGGAASILEALVESVERLLDHRDGHVADLLSLEHDSVARAPSFEAEDVEITPLPGPNVIDDVSRTALAEYSSLRDLLLRECRTLLRTNAFGAHDSFFASGGNSVHAVRLHAKLETLTGRSIPLLELFKNPSVDEMAKATVENKWPAQQDLVRVIRESGSERPVLCITAPGVRPIGYVALIERLSPDRPVYILQSPDKAVGMAGFTMEHVSELTARYLDAMKQVTPDGPYNFLSMCGGAHIAVEMARRLADNGEPVGFVGIVNTWSFYTVSPWKMPLWRLKTRYQYYRRRLRELGLKGAAAKFFRSSESREPAAAVAAERSDGDALEQARSEHGEDEWWRVAGKGPPRPPERFDGTLTVFRVKKHRLFRVNDASLGWRDYARAVELHDLSAEDHLDVMRGPGLEELAAKLDACLNQPSETT